MKVGWEFGCYGWLKLAVTSQSEPTITLISLSIDVPSSPTLSHPFPVRILLLSESSLPNSMTQWETAPVGPHLPP